MNPFEQYEDVPVEKLRVYEAVLSTELDRIRKLIALREGRSNAKAAHSWGDPVVETMEPVAEPFVSEYGDVCVDRIDAIGRKGALSDKISAIKCLRQAASDHLKLPLGLKESKDFCDALEYGAASLAIPSKFYSKSDLKAFSVGISRFADKVSFQDVIPF